MKTARKFIKGFLKFQQNSALKTIDGNISAICNNSDGMILKFNVNKETPNSANITAYLKGNNKVSTEVEIGEDYEQFVLRVGKAVSKKIEELSK